MTLGDFSNQAQAYGKSRPSYPPALIDLLIADAGLVPLEPDQNAANPGTWGHSSSRSKSHVAAAVADFGAGTGILTRILVEGGFDVSAIEPNALMRSQAQVPEARWIAGTFEQSGLPTSSQRWAIAAQAFHWADPPRCLPEIRRILQPGCLFTVLWNNRVPIKGDVVNWTESAIRRLAPEFDESYRNMQTDKVLESTGDFTFVGHRSVKHTIEMSKQRYLELWRSHNRLNTIAGPERFQMFFGLLSDYLEQNHVDRVDVRYTCDAWSARRNG